jgi:hypothetical protein
VHAVPWRGMDSLQQLLTCSGQLGSTLYYRLLDMPLAEWESMKTVKVRSSIWCTLPEPLQMDLCLCKYTEWGRWFCTNLAVRHADSMVIACCAAVPAQVAFHNERTEEVGKEGYRVRVPKTATVAQLLEQVPRRSALTLTLFPLGPDRTSNIDKGRPSMLDIAHFLNHLNESGNGDHVLYDLQLCEIQSL